MKVLDYYDLTKKAVAYRMYQRNPKPNPEGKVGKIGRKVYKSQKRDEDT